MWIGAIVLAVLVKHGVGQASWWSNAVYYRVLVDSFKDGDGDGLGDIKGLIKQISYVRALGSDAVILSPLSARSTVCNKPGVTGFADIDQRYGDDATFSAFMEKTKKIELKVVVTLPLQTISAGSDWFSASANKDVGFEDRIWWRDGSADQIPEVENGIEGWTWSDTRKAYWAHRNNQAVLNLCSESVAASLATAQCTWLKRGVAGVLLNPDFPIDQECAEQLLRKMIAEAISCTRGVNMDTPSWRCAEATTTAEPAAVAGPCIFCYRWRASAETSRVAMVAAALACSTNGNGVILVETSLKPELAAKYYSEAGIGANSILSKALTSPSRSSAPELGLAIHADLLNAPQGIAPTWITSESNQSRVVTRYGGDLADTMNLLALILPGAAIIQQGDELGAADTIMEWATSSDTCWPSDVVPSAAPLPWDDTPNAGFTTGTPWIPIAPNYRYANAKTEFSNDNSHVGILRVAAAMRKSPAMGPHAEIQRLGDALAVLRWGGAGTLLVVTNLARDQTEAKLTQLFGLPAELTVAASSAGSRYPMGSHVATDKVLKLSAGETLLLAGAPRHCGGPGPVDKIALKLSEGWQKINKYFKDF